MPLLMSLYSLSDGSISVTYKIWERAAGPVPEPDFVPASVLEVDVGKGPVSYSPSEVELVQVPPLAALLLTVTMEPAPDGGTTFFSVLLPKFATQQSPGAFTNIQGVAVITQMQTTLNNVHSPTQTYTTTIVKGYYTCELPT
jgi:hypothetical protein